jgi:adenosylcobinamide-GDP ribazoletransferase
MSTSGMDSPRYWLSRLVTDIKIGILFCTRLPLPHATPVTGSEVAQAAWAQPIAGVLVAGVGALVYWLALQCRLPVAAAAALALLATLLTTGCLHEDGLADTADGFGGGRDAARKLEIMRDSRIGTYGMCALTMSLLLRWSALAAIAQPSAVACALVAAHAAGRAPLPLFMRLVPPARADGLAAGAGPPPAVSAAAATLIGVVALGLALGPRAALVGALLLAASGAAMARLTMRQIGGQTGDVIGALEQLNETLILLAGAALLSGGAAA